MSNGSPQADGHRKATVARKTKETDIQVELDLDGSGQYEVTTVSYTHLTLPTICSV